MKGNVGSSSRPSDSCTLIMIQFFEAAEVGGMTRDDKRLLERFILYNRGYFVAG